MSPRIKDRMGKLGRSLRSFFLDLKETKNKATQRQSKEVKKLAQDSSRDDGNKEIEIRGASLSIPERIQTQIISVEMEGVKLPTIALDQQVILDWNAIIKNRGQIERYTQQLSDVDDTLDKLQEAKVKAVKAGNEFVGARKSSMRLEDIINTEVIQGLTTEIRELNYKLGVKSKEKRILTRKLTHAQNILDTSQPKLEKSIHDLLQEHNLLEEEPIPDDGHISEVSCSSTIYCPSPINPRIPLPTPTEIERRETEQKIWDLSEKAQMLRERLDGWPGYRSDKHVIYLQALEARETFDTQTIFDHKLLRESQITTRDLIETETKYAEAKKRARELGVFVDDGEQEEGFSEYDDDGYTISQEESMVYGRYLGWIYGWMGETPESSAEPDVVGVEEVEVDEWNAKTVEMSDSVSVRELFTATGRRRERIDEYRKAWESREISQELMK